MANKEATRPVRKGEELDEGRLKHFMKLHGLVADEKNELIVEQFSNGFSNLTYLLHIGQKEYVLRRPPFAAPKRGHNMGREFKVLHSLQQVFDKIPKVHAYTENLDVLGVPFYIMSKVDGIILTEAEVGRRNISPPEFARIADTWLDTFVQLHAVDYKSAGLESLGRPEGYVARQVENWGKQYHTAATDEVVTASKVMAWLEANQPKSYQHSLIHNDYKYDNVVFKDDQWNEIAAILDWEMCTLGDPLMDLGTSLAYWTTATDKKHGLSPTTALEGNPTRSEIVQKYALKSGRNIDHLTFYFAYGFFKIAVIVQQIYYRYKHGHTADPRFAELNKITALCCDSAWQAIQKNRIDDLY